MKNLWRVIVLFLLPGVIGGIGSVIGFFRLSDSGFEPLKNSALAAVVWCCTAAVAMYFTARIRRVWRLYYPAVAVMFVLFTSGVGLCRLAGWYGTGEGVAAIVVSALAWSWLVQAFCSKTYKTADRWYFITGVILGGGCCLHAEWGDYLSWLETRFFYLTELVLLFWCYASPLTRRGRRSTQHIWRWGLFAAAVIGVYLSPVLAFKAWNPPPEQYRDFLWQKTSITANGSWFQWVGRQGKTVVSNASGRLLLRDVNDEEFFAAMPGLLGVLNKENPMVLAVTPVNSVLPAALQKLAGAKVRKYYLPVSRFLHRYGLRAQTPVFFMNKSGDIVNCRKYDLLLISALPENQYPGVVRRFLAYMTTDLKDDAVVALPAVLLRNQTVFNFMHEKFKYNGILPAPGRLWVFSQKTLELEPEKLERNFNAVSGSEQPLLQGVYGSIFSSGENADFFPDALPLENNQWGRNSIYGSWWYILLAAGGILLWRMFRLAGERRNIMYSYWNCMENGFSAMTAFLLSVGLLVTESGACSLLVAAAAVIMGAFSFARWHMGGSIGLLTGLLLMFFLKDASALAQWFLLAVMAQSMFFLNSGSVVGRWSLAEKQKLSSAAGWGMMVAAVVMYSVWACDLPLILPWIWAAAACMGGILQNTFKRVY